MNALAERLLLVCAAGFSTVALSGCRSSRALEPGPPVAPTSAADPVQDTAPSAVVATPAPAAEDVSARIEELLRTIAESELTFIRNGAKHGGAAAAAHIRSKYESARAEIASPEDFIEKAATRSIQTGKPYLVELADGTREPLSEWLRARLRELRAVR